MKEYRHSKLRRNLLLVLFTIIVYHIFNGKDTDVQILAGFVLGVWLLAANDWRKG